MIARSFSKPMAFPNPPSRTFRSSRKFSKVLSWQARGESGANSYQRARDLPRLLPLWPREIADYSLAGTRRIVAGLRKAMRAERRRGLAGQWSYDLSRHMALATALKAERARLTALQKR